MDHGGPVVEMVVDPEILAQVQKETENKLKELEAETGMAESEKARIMEQLKATDTHAEAMRRAKGNKRKEGGKKNEKEQRKGGREKRKAGNRRKGKKT